MTECLSDELTICLSLTTVCLTLCLSDCLFFRLLDFLSISDSQCTFDSQSVCQSVSCCCAVVQQAAAAGRQLSTPTFTLLSVLTSCFKSGSTGCDSLKPVLTGHAVSGSVISPDGGVSLSVAFILGCLLKGAHVQLRTTAHQHLHLLRTQQLPKKNENAVIHSDSLKIQMKCWIFFLSE